MLARDYKIYDSFLFFNEFEILRIRLEELYDEVDYFVLVESTRSFRGKEKPLYFQEHKHLYAKYFPKLIHVIVEDDILVDKDNAWEREAFQRNAILRGLSSAQDSDIVIVSDVDEIPKRESIARFIKMIKEEGHNVIRSQGLFYRFFLNRQEHYEWCGPVIGSYVDLRTITPEGFRSVRLDNRLMVAENSHWHFTSMGGYASYYEKLSSFSHWNEYPFRPLTPGELYASLQESLLFVDLDDSFPHFVRANKSYFCANNFIDHWQGLPHAFSENAFQISP